MRGENIFVRATLNRSDLRVQTNEAPPKNGASQSRAGMSFARDALMNTQRTAVIIGTGAGGLSAAAHLAKRGFQVVALDQADRIGGFLAPFTLEGYTFDPGVHYVGRARCGQVFDATIGELGVDVERLFVEMDPEGFDIYRFPDFEVRAISPRSENPSSDRGTGR